MKYNIEKYNKDLAKKLELEMVGWLFILLGCGVFAWLCFEFAMLVTGRASLLN